MLRQLLDLRRPPRPASRSVAPHPLCGEGGWEVVSAHESASGRRCTPAHRPRCGRRHRAWRLACRPPAAHRLHLVFSAAKLRRRAGLRCLFRRHARAGLRRGPRLCDGLAAPRRQAGGSRRACRRDGGGRRRPVLLSYHRGGDGREARDDHDPDRVFGGERSGRERLGPVVGATRGATSPAYRPSTTNCTASGSSCCASCCRRRARSRFSGCPTWRSRAPS